MRLMRAVRVANHWERTPVKRHEGLLILALHRDRVDSSATIGLEQRLAVGPVGFAPTTVELHVVGGRSTTVKPRAIRKRAQK